MDKIKVDWRGASLYSECTWHQLSPYIGRMKSSMARSLVEQFTEPGDCVCDPFSGAGTVPLEAWMAGRSVLAGDVSPYAYVLTRAKLNPPKHVAQAERRLDKLWVEAKNEIAAIDLRSVPKWVREFFHPETLREAIAVRNVLVRRREHFLLSCLLGILHHWRPGFLSYPSSHTVPYLKNKLYPKDRHAELYRYREVYPRLRAKLHRAFARVPDIDRQLARKVREVDARGLVRNGHRGKISAIITSPPYMNSLSYARDNRLRLWFLGVDKHKELEPRVSPRKAEFLGLMRELLAKWSGMLGRNGVCVLVLGAVRRNGRHYDLPGELLKLLSERCCHLKFTGMCRSVIPDVRRVRLNCKSTREDTIIVLRKGK